jgi:DNA-binding FadR family transcriptional regulator
MGTKTRKQVVRFGRKRRAQSLTQRVVAAIEKHIRNGTLRPGEKLPPEAGIMAQQGVSRTVVREAISKLQAAGLVETRHGIGTFVLEVQNNSGFRIDANAILTIRDLMQMLEFRLTLEGDAAAFAAMRAGEEDLQEMRRHLSAFEEACDNVPETIKPDYAFHLQVASATKNHYFREIMSHLSTAILPRTRFNTGQVGQDSQTPSLQQWHREHQDIYDAIARHDPEAARAAMRTHLTNSRERLRRAQDTVENAVRTSGKPR